MADLQDIEENAMTYSVYVKYRVDKLMHIVWACDTKESLPDILLDERCGWYLHKYHGRLYCVADTNGVVRFYDKKHKRFYPFEMTD